MAVLALDLVFLELLRSPEEPLFTFSQFTFVTVVLSERLKDHVKFCEIRDEIYGASDHCPVTLEIEGNL